MISTSVIAKRFEVSFRDRGFTRRGRSFLRTNGDASFLASFLHGPQMFEPIRPPYIPIPGARELTVQIDIARIPISRRMGIDLYIEKPELGYGVGQAMDLTQYRGERTIYVVNTKDLEENFDIIYDRLFTDRFDFWLTWLDDEVFVSELFNRSFSEDGVRRNGTSIVQILCALYLSYKMKNPLREIYHSWVKADVESDIGNEIFLMPLEFYKLAIAAINEDFPGAF